MSNVADHGGPAGRATLNASNTHGAKRGIVRQAVYHIPAFAWVFAIFMALRALGNHYPAWDMNVVVLAIGPYKMTGMHFMTPVMFFLVMFDLFKVSTPGKGNTATVIGSWIVCGVYVVLAALSFGGESAKVRWLFGTAEFGLLLLCSFACAVMMHVVDKRVTGRTYTGIGDQ